MEKESRQAPKPCLIPKGDMPVHRARPRLLSQRCERKRGRMRHDCDVRIAKDAEGANQRQAEAVVDLPLALCPELPGLLHHGHIVLLHALAQS
jgi:hypothetical protein